MQRHALPHPFYLLPSRPISSHPYLPAFLFPLFWACFCFCATHVHGQDAAPESLGAWDRELNADNLSLLKGHLPTLELYDDVELVDEKMLDLEEAVVATGRALNWRTEHLDAAQEPEPRKRRQPTGKASKGERRRSRWLTQVQQDSRLSKKKAKEIEAMLYE